MSQFYPLRREQPELTKAESIELAGQNTIAGKNSPISPDDEKRAEPVDEKGKTVNGQPAFKNDLMKSNSHPFCWSPFILIGSRQ